MKAAGEAPAARPPAGHIAPGPALLAAAAAVLLAPIVLAALYPLLPALLRSYLIRLPLPVLEVEFALAFALFGLPLFNAPDADGRSPVLTGLARGLFLGAVALPFLLAARIAWPVPAGAVLAGCLLVAALGAGSVAAAARFGTGGLVLAIALAALPGLFGYLAVDVCAPLVRLGRLSPFVAAEMAARGEAAWGLGLLPGVALLAAVLASPRGGTHRPGVRADHSRE